MKDHTPVNTAALQKALEGLSVEELNRPVGEWGWTALKCLALWKGRTPEEDARSNMGEAARILLAAGADPVGPQLSTGPLGSAITYERYDVLKAILDSLTPSTWEPIVTALTEKRSCRRSEFVGGEWVEHDGKRCYVASQISDEGGLTSRQPALSCTIQTESGVSKSVDVDKLVLLPSVYAKVKAELVKAASASGCGPDVIDRLNGLEERRGGYIDLCVPFVP